VANPLPSYLFGQVPEGFGIEEVTKIIKETPVSIEERYPIEIEALGPHKNHLYVLSSAHPKVGPGRIVQIFKSITAREILRRRPGVKRELWGGVV